MYNLTYESLYHYGVKGQKWGVRRTKEELHYNKGSVESVVNHGIPKIAASHGVLVTKISSHAAEQAEDRKVQSKDIIDALKSPIHVSEPIVDKLGRKSIKYVGRHATVAVNPDTGVIPSVWPTGEQRLKKYLKEK